MITGQRLLKSVLWALVGVLVAVTAARFVRGLGATTNLTDAAPWGLWIAFDVMAGVALAAGGFVVAAVVYIFKLERYRPLARPAILTAFLGYAAVAVGLLYDLGLPWHIYHPILYPQPHSVLFEVAMCVMLYLTVLLLEFAPTVLEHPLFHRPVWQKIHRGLKRISLVLVITGIVLSTLHQSSLGSLYLIAPFRLHPLWYSPMIWVFFFVSAVGLGLMTVVLEAYFSGWFMRHPLRMELLAGLGRAASLVLLLYAALRLGDLGWRGLLPQVFDGSPMSALFLFELGLSAVVPGLMLLVPRVRRSPAGLGAAALMSVLGVIGYRFDVCLVAFKRPDGASYFPSFTEIAVSAGIVAAALLVFIFFVEHLKVCEGETHVVEPASERAFQPGTLWSLAPETLAAPRRYSLALVLGVSVAVALLPNDALFGSRPVPVGVSAPRSVAGLLTPRVDGQGHEIVLSAHGPGGGGEGESARLMLIDGNRDGRLVFFPHERHQQDLGGSESCGKCHHQNLPYQLSSSCAGCHRDMYGETDTFDHQVHVDRLGGNGGCVQCHRDPAQAKTRATSTPCAECHRDMIVAGSRIRPREAGLGGHAVSYMDALHGLCVDCHESQVQEHPEKVPEQFAECATCHREAPTERLRALGPYLTELAHTPGGG